MKRAPGVRLTDGYSHSAFFYLLQLHPSPGQDRPRRYLMQVCCKRRHITYADVSLMCRRAYLYVSLMCRFVQLMCRLCILHCGLCVSPVSVCLNYISAVFLLKTPACRTDLLLDARSRVTDTDVPMGCRCADAVSLMCYRCADAVSLMCRLRVAYVWYIVVTDCNRDIHRCAADALPMAADVVMMCRLCVTCRLRLCVVHSCH